jgi:hypothetical protein
MDVIKFTPFLDNIYGPHINAKEYIYIYVLDAFPLLASSNEFEGTPMEAPLDGSVTRDADEQITTKRTRTRGQLSNAVLINGRMNCNVEMFDTISRSTVTFVIWSHCYTRTRKVSQNMNFIFSILLKEQ